MKSNSNILQVEIEQLKKLGTDIIKRKCVRTALEGRGS